MSESSSAGSAHTVPISSIGIRRRPRLSFAVIGNPNSGKSTLFNRLTGLRQSTGNYPGVTVEKHAGTVELASGAVELIDLPGIFSLGGASSDERIAVDVLLGRIAGTPAPAGLLVVVDATHLYQGLYLLQQLLELQSPIVVALTMSDVATANGLAIDVEALQTRLGGIQVVPVTATTGQGLDALKEALDTLASAPVPRVPESWPALSESAQSLADESGQLSRMDVIQGLLHPGGPAAVELVTQVGEDRLQDTTRELFGTAPPQAEEARRRYRWAREVVHDVQSQAPLLSQFGARVVTWASRPWPATVLFFITLVLVFQAVFSWATPLMDLIDGAAGSAGLWVDRALGG
ncbi:MAG: ferrous iron transporter B, partial [Xanthomonadales bacterium]|nr:ferrous iron transporter B [Xanthomonadales bacterium]